MENRLELYLIISAKFLKVLLLQFLVVFLMRRINRYYFFFLFLFINDIVIYTRLGNFQEAYELSIKNLLLNMLAIHKRNIKEYKPCIEEYGLLTPIIPDQLKKKEITSFALYSRHKVLSKVLSKYDNHKSSKYVFDPTNWYIYIFIN